MKLLLQHRILLGYIILIAVIGSMAAIMFHERNRVDKIEEEMIEIREANQTINAAHRHITVLATLGESAITWDEEDYKRYRLRRQKVDSLLLSLQETIKNLLRPNLLTRSAFYWKTKKNICSIPCWHSNGRAACCRNKSLPLLNRQRGFALSPAGRKVLQDSLELKRLYKFRFLPTHFIP